MTCHDLSLAHLNIGEKAVSRLGIGPILTGYGTLSPIPSDIIPSSLPNRLASRTSLKLHPPTSLSIQALVVELLVMISDFVADFLVCIPRFHHKWLNLYI